MFKRAKPENIRRARELRGTMTAAELKLLYHLRALHRYGFHFRRQSPFRGYYLDFVEHKTRLVVEVDGGSHFDSTGKRHHNTRDRVLASQGYRTLRFDKGEVLGNLEGVMEDIWRELQARSHPPPPGALRAPTSPQRGR